MRDFNETLKQYLREQIALEEHLMGVLVAQLDEMKGEEDLDAHSLLVRIAKALKEQFGPLNELLDELDREIIDFEDDTSSTNGIVADYAASPPFKVDGQARASVWKGKKARRLSRLLRDDFSALNLVAINNSLLHTSAVALQNPGVATVALRHVQNLVPLLVTMGTVVTAVAARELGAHPQPITPRPRNLH